MRLGPARGDPQTAPQIRHAVDIGGVGKTVVPAVSAALAAPTPAAVPGPPAPAPDTPHEPTPAESAAQKTAAAAARTPAPKLAPAPKAAATSAAKPGYAEAQLKALQEVGDWRPLLRWPIAAVRSAAAALGVSQDQTKPALCKELWDRRSGGRGAAVGRA